MMGLIAFGSFWFWALIVAEIVLLLIFTNFDNGVAASLSVVAFMMILGLFGDDPFLKFIFLNPFMLGVSVVSYMTIGIAWLIFKWNLFVRNKLRRHDDMLAEYVMSVGLPEGTTELPLEYREKWINIVESTSNFSLGEKTTIASVPKARHNKARIFRWWSLWLPSMILFFFKDMLVELWNFIYSRIAGYLQRLANSVFAKEYINNNLQLPKKN